MRRVAVLPALLFVGSVLPGCGLNPPPRQTEFPTLSPGDTYNTRMADLRTVLARSGISLRVGGVSDSFSTCDEDEDPDNALRRIFGYCVRCELANQATPVDGAVIEAATKVFREYPAAVLAAHHIDHVAMCNEIIYAKPDETQHPAGLADPTNRGLLISVSEFLDRTYSTHSDFNMSNIVHHELFHLLEYERMPADARDDPEWRLFNPLGFEYDAHPAATQRPAGFVNAYATTNASEDRASTYEFLMSHPDALCDIARTDETVRIKTKIIWRRVLRAVGTDTFIRAAAPCVDWLDT